LLTGERVATLTGFNLLSVGGHPLATTVLIVDHDLGFVFWLGHALDGLGYSALPAKTIADAALLIMQLDLKVDVLLINVSLPGAAEFAAAVHRNQPQVKVIGILETHTRATTMPGVSIAHYKPATTDHLAKAEWIECIEGVLTSTVVSTAAHQ